MLKHKELIFFIYKKSPGNISILGASLFIKEGGFLLSRIALQYHRRKWA